MTHPRRWLFAAVVLLFVTSGAAGIWVFNGTINARAVEVWVAEEEGAVTIHGQAGELASSSFGVKL